MGGDIMRKCIFDWILRIEGGYVNDPLDHGGETNYGITWKTLEEAYNQGIVDYTEVSKLNLTDVELIYEKMYYDTSKANEMNFPIDWCHVDAAINHGPGRAGKFMQTVINDYYPGKLTVDGVLGPMSMYEVHNMMMVQSPKDIINRYLTHREAFYHRIVENNPSQQRFIKGWMNRLKWLVSAIKKETIL